MHLRQYLSAEPKGLQIVLGDFEVKRFNTWLSGVECSCGFKMRALQRLPPTEQNRTPVSSAN